MRDRSRYPKNWKKLSRFVRFERAGGCCEVCGARHNLPHPEAPKIRTILHAAHIDHEGPLDDPANIVTCCQRCHMKLDGRRHARSRKYGRHHRANQINLFENDHEQESNDEGGSDPGGPPGPRT